MSAPSSNTSGSAVVRLVAGREIRQRLGSKAFLISTALIVVVLIGVAGVYRLTSDSGPSKEKVGLVGEAPAGFATALAQVGDRFELEIKVSAFDDRRAAELALKDGDIEAAVLAGDGQVVFETDSTGDLADSIGAAWQVASSAQAAEDAGLSGAETDAVLRPEALAVVVLEPEDDDDVGRLVGMATAVLLFISVTTFGGFVLSGVVEEKTTAVVEILLAHVRAHHLLAGKVLGIGTVALVQFAATMAAGLIALFISGTTVPTEVWVSVPAALLWFIAGFALYSTLFALAGSFVSRQDDAQAAAAPISMCFTAGYIVVFAVGGSPDSLVATILSLLPPFAPLLMPLRMATGDAAVWQIVLSAALLIGSAYGILRVAGRMYAHTVLHRGTRITWRQALKMTS